MPNFSIKHKGYERFLKKKKNAGPDQNLWATGDLTPVNCFPRLLFKERICILKSKFFPVGVAQDVLNGKYFHIRVIILK